MTHITDDEMADLPEDPEEAFIQLESTVRERLETQIYKLDHDESPHPLKRRYMSIVLKAAQHYNIADLSSCRLPSLRNEDWQTYDSFIAEVDYCMTGLRLRKAERLKEHSVALDAAAKIKLRHLLEQIRETVDKLDVSVAKKEALYSRINSLLAEIERTRTRWAAFAALMIEACDDIGQAAKKLEPVVRLIERVGAAIGVAKRAEDAQPRLPAPKTAKRIDYDKSSGFGASQAADGGFGSCGKSGFDKALDDEIPF